VVRALARPARQSAHGAVSGAALRAVGLARRRVTRLFLQAKDQRPAAARAAALGPGCAAPSTAAAHWR
jgi:hypothetical protein